MSTSKVTAQIQPAGHGFIVTICVEGLRRRVERAPRTGIGLTYLMEGGGSDSYEETPSVTKHYAFSTTDEMLGFIGALYYPGSDIQELLETKEKRK